MKKIMVLFTALFLMLAGCSSGGESGTTDQSGSAETSETAETSKANDGETSDEEAAGEEAEGDDQASGGEYGDLTIRVGTSGTSDVFSIIDPDTEEWQGIDAGVWNAIAEETGWTIDLTQSQFDGLIGELQAGRIDAVSNHMGVTDERNEQALPSAPYSTTASVIIVTDKNDEITSVEDLAGKTVGVKSGQSVQPIVVDLSEEIGFTVKTYQENPEMYSDLAMGRSDAVIGMQASIQSFSEDLGIQLKEVGDPLELNEVVFYLQKNEEGEALAAKLNPVIEKLVADGTFSEVSIEWSGVDLPGNLEN